MPIKESVTFSFSWENKRQDKLQRQEAILSKQRKETTVFAELDNNNQSKWFKYIWAVFIRVLVWPPMLLIDRFINDKGSDCCSITGFTTVW